MKLKKIAFGALIVSLVTGSCSPGKPSDARDPVVTANIKKYSAVWDSIINQGKLELFDPSNFSKNVVFHSAPTDIVGIEPA